MENAIPYYGDLHIEAGTKEIILKLISTIRSVVPVAESPEPFRTENDRLPGKSDMEPEPGSMDELRNVLILARQYSRELDGLFDPNELLRYINRVSDYQDIIDQLEKCLEEMRASRNSAFSFASALARLLEEHIEMVSPCSRIPAETKDLWNKSDPGGIKLKVV